MAATDTVGSSGDRFLPTHDRRWHHHNEQADNHLVYAIHETVFRHAAKTYARGSLLDIGCGRKPLAPIFEPFVTRHIGIDHGETPHGTDALDIVATAYRIPLADCSADTILMSAVLEHLERPGDALNECWRLLRPGGHAIITAPFMWPIHEAPRDFYRYSPYGLRFLLEQANFEVVEVRPFSGVWTTLALEIAYATRKYQRKPFTPIVRVLTRAMQCMMARWDRVDYQPQFSWAHLAVARRPAIEPEPKQMGTVNGNLRRP
jgi:SAM-dependent methyltransferase